MDALREALKELREEQDLRFAQTPEAPGLRPGLDLSIGYEGHPTDPRDEKFALGYLYKAVVLAIEKEEHHE